MPLVTILIEDSPTIRESLIPALVELANAEVIAVDETAAEGIAVLQAHSDRWHLAVVDLWLKEGTGLEVLRAGHGPSRKQQITRECKQCRARWIASTRL